jgi:hypothetical protein
MFYHVECNGFEEGDTKASARAEGEIAGDGK